MVVGGCCDFQSRHYETQGRVKGMAPATYFSKATDFSVGNKHVNWIYVRSDRKNIQFKGLLSKKFLVKKEHERFYRKETAFC